MRRAKWERSSAFFWLRRYRRGRAGDAFRSTSNRAVVRWLERVDCRQGKHSVCAARIWVSASKLLAIHSQASKARQCRMPCGNLGKGQPSLPGPPDSRPVPPAPCKTKTNHHRKDSHRRRGGTSMEQPIATTPSKRSLQNSPNAEMAFLGAAAEVFKRKTRQNAGSPARSPSSCPPPQPRPLLFVGLATTTWRRGSTSRRGTRW